ncbi:DUF1446 domain-containing protein [Histoplasma ohiense]|nr:DUF1446 domain-containing protein [Histoplasma ohiense (nom. inval.)]
MLCHDLEMNLAEHAESMAAGQHPGYDPYAWDGIQQSIDAIAVKRIKIIINGGALNPQGLAVESQKLVSSRGYDLKVAYVGGDNLLDEVRDSLTKTGTLPAHLDSSNPEIQTQAHTNDLLDTQGKPVVSANAYLGARAIVKGLEAGADIIICGRVADASPVIAAAWYWHGWKETDYDALAGALIAGHLIECSAYVTGSNFSGFTEYDLEVFVDLAFGIVEVDAGGSCVVTKHEGTKGLVNTDVVKCQFLYELQGDVYLNSDVKAYTQNISIEAAGKDRYVLYMYIYMPSSPATLGIQLHVLLNPQGASVWCNWRHTTSHDKISDFLPRRLRISASGKRNGLRHR